MLFDQSKLEKLYESVILGEMFPHILNIIRLVIAKRANIDNEWVQKTEPLYKKYL
jgi:hypothetical protein